MEFTIISSQKGFLKDCTQWFQRNFKCHCFEW